MSVSLDPVVAGKLQHFGRRRFWLIVARGASAGLVTFLLCMAVVAFIDWYWLLTEQTRWLLSIAAYLTVFGVVWMTGLRRMIHVPAKEELAGHVEQAEPELRENLVSAIELATDNPAALHDSPVFRSLLQGQVARQMGTVQVTRLLPFRLIGKWVLAAGAVGLVAALLLSSGDPRFRQLAARAVLPGANIARVSRIQVEVLQPTPHSLLLAENETVAVVVEVTGGNVDEVTLETVTQTQGTVRQPMRGRTDIEFAGNIHVADEDVEYRILAGDAVTQRFLIESRPRPRVTAFHKTFQYPEYSRLPQESVTETHGDLMILEGTTTELTLDIDQDVSVAELRIDPADSDDVRILPLTKGQNSRQWTVSVPGDLAAIYKVHLVSEETGFDNLFSPKYEIRPQPDLIPRTGFVDQQEPTLLLPPNDILNLKAMAEDDLPLEKLEQQISVNGREWQAVTLQPRPDDDSDGRLVHAAWEWDLLDHELKVGDQLTTKLVATDRKGNTGESIPLRIVVAAPEFDPERHSVMEQKLGLYPLLKDFSDLLQQQKDSAHEVIERLRDTNRSAEQQALDRTTLLDLASKQQQHAAELMDDIKAVEREMPAGADAIDLDLTGRVVARLQQEHASTPAYLLKAAQHADGEKERNGDLEDLKRVFSRTADDADNLAKHYQSLAMHNFLAALAFDFDALLRQQQLVFNSPTQTWDRLLRQETVVINQLRVVERLMRDHRRSLPKSLDHHLNSLLNWSETYRQRLRDATESEDKLEELKRVSGDVLSQLEQKQRLDALDGGLPSRLIGVRKDFDNRAGSLYVPLDQLARAIQQENRLAALASASEDSAEGKQLLNKAERYVSEIDLKHRQSIQQLRSRRELVQTRRDSDSQYASDAGLTHRAVSSLLHQHRESDPQQSPIADHMLEVAPAYRTLEAGHYLIVARDALSGLLNQERWDSQDLQAHIDHPRQWDLVQLAWEFASNRLREAGVQQEIVGKLDQVRWSASTREANRKISERRWRRDLMVSAAHELVDLRDNLAIVVTEMQPVMAEARAIIAKYAPTIPEMAEQAAEQLRTLEQATTDAADQAEQQPEATDANQRMAELEQQQKQVNEQIQDLFEALVEDANSQDLLDEQQRERARDADDSIAIIQEPATQMNRAMQQAQQAESTPEQTQQLAQAAEQQERTAQALDLVAEHFQRLDEGMDVAESREELRQAERDQGIARQMDQQFSEAEQLSRLAQQESRQLMTELEAELKQNPAMQQALSEISKNALQDAQQALEYAAQDDQNIQRSNERSDEAFQQKKRDLAEDLRKMGEQASRLSNYLVAHADQAAASGKTSEAQQKLAEARQKLNEAAQQAQSAREEQLLKDLAQTAQQTKDVLREATNVLQQAKQQTAQGKDQQIHNDDKSRDAAKRDFERRRQQFHDQQKRIARDDVKRADDAKRRAEQNSRNQQQQVRRAEQQVQQAKKNAERNPENEGLKNAVIQQERNLQAQQQRLQLADEAQKRAEKNAQDAREAQQQVERRSQPPLDAANPATQLADQYAEEAVRTAENLARQAEQLASSSEFGNELTPQRKQLASAQEQQGFVKEDVQQAASDVARAARHERRLDNSAVAEPLNQSAERIQQVASNEATTAEQQLESAVQTADQAEANSQQNPAARQQAQQAQQALANSEAAISAQAEQLGSQVEQMLAASEADSADGSEDAASSQQAASAQSPSGAQQGSNSDSGSPTSQTPAAAFTPEQLAQGQQLARTLDELDRQLAASSEQNGASPQSPTPSVQNLPSLAQAAQTQQAAMAAARQQNQQQANLAMSDGGLQSSDNPSANGPMEDFTVTDVNREDAKEWGKLRSKSAEDTTSGRSQAVAEEYRRSVEAYFKVLAERSRQQK